MSDRPRPKFTLKSVRNAAPPVAASHQETEKSDLELRLKSFQSAAISVTDKLIGQTITGMFPSNDKPSYRIQQVIGQGGIGCVYRAVEESGKKKAVAVKILSEAHCDNDEIRQRFKREARIMHDLDHRNAVKVFSFGNIGKRMFLVMEHLEGHDLHQELQRNGLLNPRAVRGIMIQACDALSAAHEKGVVHRDIKPGNIFLTADDHGRSIVKVLDFGLALSNEKLDDRTRLTMTGTTFGTPAYMAPEHIMGAKKVDRRSDVYSLGVTMYVTLCGQLPFPGETLIEKINGMGPHIKPKAPSEVAPQNGISPEMDAIAMRAISYWPHQRFSNMGEFREALQQCDRNERATVPPGTEGRPSQLAEDSEPPTQLIITQRPSAMQGDAKGTADQTIPEISIPMEELVEVQDLPAKLGSNANRTGRISIIAVSVIAALASAWTAWHLLDPGKGESKGADEHGIIDGGAEKP